MLLSESFGGFTPFSRALDGLDPNDAVRKPDSSPHSVLEVLAHIVFWQQRFLSMVDGEKPVAVHSPAVGWPGSEAKAWPGLVERYLAGLARYRELAADEGGLTRKLREGGEATVGNGILGNYFHEVHHLGQIILLRRMIGAWPTPGADAND